MKKAVVLLSGGIDSTVTAYLARKDIGKEGELYALTFEYGQLTRDKEVSCAVYQAQLLGVVRHIILPISLSMVGGSSLVGEGEIPTEKSSFITGEGVTLVEVIPSTWVPQRNAVFLAIGFGLAEVVGADLIYIGLNVVDYSGYPDCRPVFVEAMQRALNLASKQFVETGRGIGIVTPLSKKSKAEIIKLGGELGIDWSKTWSCYKERDTACGICDSCRIRLGGFKALCLEDPVSYKG